MRLRRIGDILKVFSPPHSRLLGFHLLRTIARVLVPRYRFKWPQMGWWDNRVFTDYLRRFGELGRMNTDRRWMVHQLLRLTESVPGDTAECGVFEGSSSYLICKANSCSNSHERWHFMFDSFEGLSEPSGIDGKHWRKGDLSIAQEVVKSNLSEFSSFSLHKGWIPERFSDAEDRVFSFVHIDVDLYEPTRDSIAFFYPRMSKGGIILCDDYAFTTCPGATRAIDELLHDKPEKMIPLSCGGGFLIKGCRTAESWSGPAPEDKRSGGSCGG